MAEGQGAHVSERFGRLLDLYRKPDGSEWGGQDLEKATGGTVTRSYVSNLRKGRIGSPGLDKLAAIAEAMGFPPQLWFGDTDERSERPGGLRVPLGHPRGQPPRLPRDRGGLRAGAPGRRPAGRDPVPHSRCARRLHHLLDVQLRDPAPAGGGLPRGLLAQRRRPARGRPGGRLPGLRGRQAPRVAPAFLESTRTSEYGALPVVLAGCPL